MGKPGFQSMLFLTPPKLVDNPLNPNQSPLVEIMDNVNQLITEEDEAKEILLDKELLQLLNCTPQEQKEKLGIKQFVPKKSSRNITESFKEVTAEKQQFPVFQPQATEFKYDQQDWSWQKTQVPRKKSGQAFCFPDGGWVCSSCQNYNFCGRIKCNRCSKAKSEEDYEGKPNHII